MGRLGRLATRGAWCCAAVLLVLLPAAAWAEPDGPRYYYLGPWVEDLSARETTWTQPDGTVGSVALSPTDTVPPWGFIATDAPLADPAFLAFGQDLHAEMGAGEIAAWEMYTNLDVPDGRYTLLDLLWNTLTVWADPTGQTIAPPLMPNRHGDLQLWLQGHSLVRSERIDTGHPLWPKVRDRVRVAYRQVRREATTLEAQKWLGYEERKYRQLGLTDWRELVPPDLRDRQPLKPETVYPDNFNRADGAVGTASGGWTWVITAADTAVVSSNRGQFSISGNNLNVRPPTVSGADNYLQLANVTNPTQGEPTLVVRSGYYCRRTSPGAAAQFYRFSGGWISIGSAGATSIANGDTWYASAEGTTLTSRKNGGAYISTTDTNISSGTTVRLGNWDVRNWYIDDFEGGDIGGGSIAPHVMYYQRMRAAKLDTEVALCER